MRLSHLNALRALDATLRLGSFTNAAAELGITPAAVGQRVRALEEFLGKELFVRTSTGIEPTKEARGVDDLLTSGFAKIALALEELSPEKSRKSLRVTLPESFSENWLAPVIAEFLHANPDVGLQLEPSNRDVNLLVEQYDFAIRYGPPTEGPFNERVLFGDIVVPVCSPEFALRHGLSPGLRSLERVPLIHITLRTNDPGWVSFETLGETFGFDRRHLSHGIRISKTGSGLHAAAAGQGLVLCGIVEAFHALKSGTLTLPFGASVGCQTNYVYRLVYARSRSTPQMRLFEGWIIEKSTEFENELKGYLEGSQTPA